MPSKYINQTKLEISCYTIVIRIAAINEKYPGKHEQLKKDLKGVYNNELHLVYDMGSSLSDIVDTLYDNGLRPGKDYSVMVAMPLNPIDHLPKKEYEEEETFKSWLRLEKYETGSYVSMKHNKALDAVIIFFSAIGESSPVTEAVKNMYATWEAEEKDNEHIYKVMLGTQFREIAYITQMAQPLIMISDFPPDHIIEPQKEPQTATYRRILDQYTTMLGEKQLPASLHIITRAGKHEVSDETVKQITDRYPVNINRAADKEVHEIEQEINKLIKNSI